MNKTRLYLSLAIGALAFAIHGCVDHNIPTPKVDCSAVSEIKFSTQVKGIIEAKCAIVGDGGCHNGGNGPDLDWREFDNIQARALSDELQDRLTRAEGAAGKMPKLGSLSASELQTIYCWAEQGGLNN